MDTSFIRVNFNSSIRIEAEDKVIYVDPYKIEGNPSDADYIFLTHDHYDHFSPNDIKRIVKRDTVLIFPKRMELVMKQVASSNTKIPVLPAKIYDAGELGFETVASYNKWKPFHLKIARNCGYIIKVNQTRIYIPGDMDVVKEAKAVKCDIAMLPVGGFYTMNYKEAAELVNIIKPKVAIPTHYGKVAGKDTDGLDFAKLVDNSVQVDIKLSL